MKRRNHRKKKNNIIKINNLNKSDNYEIPSQFIFSPTTCASSEKNKNEEEYKTIQKSLAAEIQLEENITRECLEKYFSQKVG